jgi:uncharacterized protein YjiS (DUF1127 family)
MEKEMTRNAKRGSITAFSTVVIEAVVTDGHRGAHLLAQAEERTRKMFVAFLRYLEARRRYQITVRALSNVGDRELADVAITRPDIHRVAWEISRNCRTLASQ